MSTLAGVARKMFAAAVAAVQPDALVAALHFDDEGVEFAGRAMRPAGRLVLVAIGKAAPGLAAAFLARCCRQPDEVFVLAPDGVEAAADLRVVVRRAAHPVPDQRGAAAARELLDLFGSLAPEDGVVLLLSGGGSALLAEPVAGLEFAEMVAVQAALLRAGCPIGGFNAVRRHLLAAAGGRLGRACACPILTLALSDVIGDDPATIASGPTVPDPTTCGDALAVLERFEVTRRAPGAVAVLRAGGGAETPKPGDPALAHLAFSLLGSSRTALRTASGCAQRLGFGTSVVTRRMRGEAREVGEWLAALAVGVGSGEPQALLFAGETTVDVRGSGCGGRNLEVALSAAVGLAGSSGRIVLAAGSDGVDGSSPAAGAVVDGDTLVRGAMAGHDAALALAANDSWGFFAGLPDAIVTGPTGTNVADVAFILVAGRPVAILDEMLRGDRALPTFDGRCGPRGGGGASRGPGES